MEGEVVELDDLNDTELWELARQQISASWRRPVRLSRSAPREYVLHLVESGEIPQPSHELIESRARLQEWIEKRWEMVNSQLPCTGPQRGKCKVYPCSEGRHLS